MRPTANSKPFVLVVVMVPFLGTVVAICSLWQQAIRLSDLVLLATMYTFTAFGLTAGFHRMLTHRSFRAHPVVKVVLLVRGSMAVGRPPTDVTTAHITHPSPPRHAGRPPSPSEGLSP